MSWKEKHVAKIRFLKTGGVGSNRIEMSQTNSNFKNE